MLDLKMNVCDSSIFVFQWFQNQTRLAVSELEIWNILAQPSPQQSYKIYAGHRAFNTNFSVYISNSVLVMVVGAVQAMQTLKYFQASSLCSRF